MAAEPGGYAVLIPKDNLPGFLPTDQKLKVGEEVLAQYVCVDKNRILLTSRFSGTASPKPAAQSAAQVQWDVSGQVKPANEQESAFDTWAASRRPQLKRATDLFLPPINGEPPNTFKIADYDLEWLITDLEGGMRTGCVKASSEDKLSRSAMLLYRGRVVGCIYGTKMLKDPLSTEGSLALMVQDLGLPETVVMSYELPEDVALSMSALFLGYPVTRSDDLDARSYADHLCNWFAEKQQTACLAFSLPSTAGTCLAFIHQGKFVGAFYVEDQTFTRDVNFVYDLLAKDPQAGVEASILPPDMTSQAVRFGFSLSMARKAQSAT